MSIDFVSIELLPLFLLATVRDDCFLPDIGAENSKFPPSKLGRNKSRDLNEQPPFGLQVRVKM